MKQITRALVAAAAAEKATGRHVEHVYDHTEELDLPVTRHISLDAYKDSDAALVLYGDADERVSVKVHDDLFSGWDYGTGDYFAGALFESEVMLYDAHERRYYKFSIH